MNYQLLNPVENRGERIGSVRVTVPPPRAFKGKPFNVKREIWDLSKIVQIPAKAAAELSLEDAAAISRLFTAMADEAKAAAGEFAQ